MTTLSMLIAWILFGFVAGLIARALYPGTQAMGIIPTTMLGIVGSFAGGFLGNLLAGAPVLQFHGAGLLGSVIGALVVMVVVGVSRRRLA